jgi:uncharacterized protein YecE (DUF72 family)
MDVKVGCCGFAVSQQRYFATFPVVEIQSTFYKLPRVATAERWRATAPAGFEFAIKAWQLITHQPPSPTYRRLGRPLPASKARLYGGFRSSDEVLEAWEKTAAFARALGCTLIVFQCPAGFTPAAENAAAMRRFFSTIDRRGFRFAWEPRGHWPPELVVELCGRLGLVHAVDPFKQAPLFGDFRYFRLHGITGYGYRFCEADLQMLLEWSGGSPAYVLFNNKSMAEDAGRFLRLLECEGSLKPRMNEDQLRQARGLKS